jgi:hypothetical protein
MIRYRDLQILAKRERLGGTDRTERHEGKE